MLYKTPHNALVGDEVFYFFQATKIKSLEFVWFNYTQPPLYTVILALFPANIILLRTVNTVITTLSLVLMYLITRGSGRYIRLLSVFITLITPIYISTTIHLYTESLFLLLLMLLIFFYSAYYKNPQNNNLLVSCGLLCLALIVTRSVTPIFLLVLALAVCINVVINKKPRRLLILALVALAIGISPLLFSGGFTINKLTTPPPARLHDCIKVYAILGIPLLTLYLASLGHFVIKKKKYTEHEQGLLLLVHIMILGYTLSFPFFKDYFPRYLMVLIPLMYLTITFFLFKTNRYFALIAGIVLVLVAITNFSSYLTTPNAEYDNRYYLTTPKTCVEITNWQYSCGNQQQAIRLPFFAVPEYSWCNFSAKYTANDANNTLVINYMSDFAYVNIDTTQVGKADSIFHTNLIPFMQSISSHTVTLIVRNEDNIGGIGQVMLCDQNFIL